ncbi:MAG: NfeD family protein [Clostridia bacterium]|nr:NfeD family protein [Clostridia bacterium]
MNITVMWLALAIILFIIEAATVGMVCMWFGIGAVVSMLCSFFITNVYIQWAIFIVAAVVMLVLLRPLAKEAISKNSEKTNVSALIGRTAFLTDDINEESHGRVKLGDISWIAVSSQGETIKKGEKVKIVLVKGNKLVVEKV